MIAVWKFKIGEVDGGAEHPVKLPINSKILAFDCPVDAGTVYLWAQVSMNEEDKDRWENNVSKFEHRTFVMYGTGEKLHQPDGGDLRHAETIVTAGGSLVWHVYEVV